MFKPKVLLERPSANDLIGIKANAKIIKAAIDEGASFLAILGGFASGKSTVVQSLKNIYGAPGSANGYQFVDISLWPSLCKSNDIAGIKHEFLLQLVSQIKCSWKRKYAYRRLNRRYGLIDAAVRNPKAAIALGFFYSCCCFISYYPSFITKCWTFESYSSTCVFVALAIAYHIGMCRYFCHCGWGDFLI